MRYACGMHATTINREILPDGSVVLRAGRGSFTYRRPRPGVLDLAVEGVDNGQFGTAALDEVALALLRERPLELFMDASRASMPAVSVSRDWARFFFLNQKDFKRVSMLAGSRAVELTVAIVQHFSHTGRLIQIYTDPDLFEARRSGQ